jgi:hypothetical protein
VRIVDGDEGVEAAQGQAVDDLLEKGEKIHPAIIIKIQANWQLTRILPGFLQANRDLSAGRAKTASKFLDIVAVMG